MRWRVTKRERPGIRSAQLVNRSETPRRGAGVEQIHRTSPCRFHHVTLEPKFEEPEEIMREQTRWSCALCAAAISDREESTIGFARIDAIAVDQCDAPRRARTERAAEALGLARGDRRPRGIVLHQLHRCRAEVASSGPTDVNPARGPKRRCTRRDRADVGRSRRRPGPRTRARRPRGDEDDLVSGVKLALLRKWGFSAS